ncbi:hypothetical protein FISHEDRAFT_76781 [Fistulina hepatica ATCC 64428]|uniref:Uncharacterized protein n=1 Tax=Fistulina hepatica ATCC 64428 TaxID=1128425 RepID=A0A0D7A385_9AGAR|nr:hypothetical protein FISHEDRAFT_76781 [Fistulina hepatica ATCC 64428]
MSTLAEPSGSCPSSRPMSTQQVWRPDDIVIAEPSPDEQALSTLRNLARLATVAAIEDADRLLQTLQPSRKHGFMTKTRLVNRDATAQWANVSYLDAAGCRLKNLQDFHAMIDFSLETADLSWIESFNGAIAVWLRRFDDEQVVQENLQSLERPGSLCPLQAELRRPKDHPFHAHPNVANFVRWAYTISSSSALTAIGEIRSVILFRERNLFEHEYVFMEFGGPCIASSFVIVERAAQLQTWGERLPFGSVGPILSGACAPLRETITINRSRERMLTARCAATEFVSLLIPQDMSVHPNDWGAHMLVTTRPLASASFYWQHRSVTPEVLRRELDRNPFGGRSLSSGDVMILAEQQLSSAGTLRGDFALVSLRSVEIMLRQASKDIHRRDDYEDRILDCWRLQMAVVHTSGELSVPRPELALDSARARLQGATDVDRIQPFTDVAVRLALTLGREAVDEVVETILRVWQRLARATRASLGYNNLKKISRELSRVALFLIGIGRRPQDPPYIFPDSAVKVAEKGKALASEYGMHPLGTMSVAAESLLSTSFAESILVTLSARPSAPSYQLRVNIRFSAHLIDHALPRKYLVSASRPGVLHMSDDEAVLLCEQACLMAAEAAEILERMRNDMSAQPFSNLTLNAASALRVHAYSLWHATVCCASAADEGDERRRKRAVVLGATEKAEKAFRNLLYNSPEALRYVTLPVLADVCVRLPVKFRARMVVSR